jgi:predicted MPP superfamily phosphohydrolase
MPIADPSLTVVAYNALVLACTGGMLVLLWKRGRHWRGSVAYLLLGVSLAALSTFGALASPMAGFGKLQLLAWATFAHYPLFLLGSAYLHFRWNRGIALASATTAAILLAIFVDAFLVEPRWLEVTHVTIPSPKLQTAVRIAVVADLQTDTLGPYEERVLRRVSAEEPDLILLAGDYLHLGDRERYDEMSERLNGTLRDAGLDPAFGIYAVRGNVDWPGRWQEIFAGLPVTTFDSSRMVDVGPLALTGLTLQDSANRDLSIAAQEKFHVVLGHTPDFSLGHIDADLLIAGHTHGGQVRLPFIGPLLTLSRVPRSWASGVTEIESGKMLVVSRGIGMERGHAPRMRFLCRPQLVILELVPSDQTRNGGELTSLLAG